MLVVDRKLNFSQVPNTRHLIVVIVRMVLSIILVSIATVVATMAAGSSMSGGGQRIQMRGTGVLHLGGLHGHSVVDDRDVDGSLVRVAGGVAVVAAVALFPASVVAAIIPGSMRGSSVGGGLGQGGVVGGLGMLHLGRIDGYSIVDYRHVIATVVNGGNGMSRTGGSMGGKVRSLGVLHLGCLNGSTVGMSYMAKGFGVGGIVLGLGGLHIGSINGHTSMSQRHMGGLSVGPSSAVNRPLVQVVSSGIVGGSSVGSGMGGLGVLHFGSIDGDASVGQHRDVDGSVGVRSIGAMGVGGSVNGSGMNLRSLRQVGAHGVEAMVRISGVGHRLHMTVTIHVGVGAVRGAVMASRLVLL